MLTLIIYLSLPVLIYTQRDTIVKDDHDHDLREKSSLHSMPEFDRDTYKKRSDFVFQVYCINNDLTEDNLRAFKDCDKTNESIPHYVKKCKDSIYGEGWTHLYERVKICYNPELIYKMLHSCIRREEIKARSNLSTIRINIRNKRYSYFAYVRPHEFRNLPQERKDDFIRFLHQVYKQRWEKLECQEAALNIRPEQVSYSTVLREKRSLLNMHYNKDDDDIKSGNQNYYYADETDDYYEYSGDGEILREKIIAKYTRPRPK